jgi:serine protease Do
MDGNVIGINSVIYSPSGGSVGIGFAIPSNMAREVVGQIQRFGTIKRGWMGVRVQAMTEDIAEGMGLAAPTGALVAEVTPGGPASKAGLQQGDVIVSFDGKPVPDSRALPRVVADTTVGKTADVQFLRGGQKQNAHLTVARLEDEKADDSTAPAATPPKPEGKLLGFSLSTLDNSSRTKYHVPPSVDGVLITAVDPDSQAAEKNFRPGDVIVAMHNEPVRSPDDVSRHLDADTKSGRKVELLLVNRDGTAAYVAMHLDGEG